MKPMRTPVQSSQWSAMAAGIVVHADKKNCSVLNKQCMGSDKYL
jgi:hypothetical protein